MPGRQAEDQQHDAADERDQPDQHPPPGPVGVVQSADDQREADDEAGDGEDVVQAEARPAADRLDEDDVQDDVHDELRQREPPVRGARRPALVVERVLERQLDRVGRSRPGRPAGSRRARRPGRTGRRSRAAGRRRGRPGTRSSPAAARSRRLLLTIGLLLTVRGLLPVGRRCCPPYGGCCCPGSCCCAGKDRKGRWECSSVISGLGKGWSKDRESWPILLASGGSRSLILNIVARCARVSAVRADAFAE